MVAAILTAVLAAPGSALADSDDVMRFPPDKLGEMNAVLNMQYLGLQEGMKPSNAHVDPALQERLREHYERARRALGG